MYENFLSNNEIKREYTTDRIHLNHKGYEVFNSVLEKEIEKKGEKICGLY